MTFSKYFHLVKNRQRIRRYVTERLRYATPRKISNFLHAESMLSKKVKHLASYPFEAIIDLTNRCNLRCPLCATGLGLNPYVQGTMALSLFSDICAQIAPYVFSVTLYNWGEPFLLKDLPAYLQICRDYRLGVTLSSNLNVNIGEEVIEALIECKVNSLVASCDGVTQDVYQIYRRNGDISKVFRNIKRIREAKRRLRSSRPRVVWQFLMMKHNQKEVEEAKRIYREVGADEIEFAFVTAPFGSDDPRLAKDFFTEEEFRNRESYVILPSDLHAPCWFLWRSLTINWDGTVSPCCYVNCDDYGFGDFRKQSLKEVWNSERYVAARGVFRGEETPIGLICKQCPVCTVKGSLL